MKNKFSIIITAFLPLLAVGLFVLIFILHYLALDIDVENQDIICIGDSAKEFRGRQVWGLASVFLFYVVCLNFIISGRIIYQNLIQKFNGMGKIILFSIISIIIIGPFIYFICCADAAGGIGRLINEEFTRKYNINVNNILEYSLAFSATSVLMTTVSMSTILFRPQKIEIDDLKRRFKQFKANLIITTIFLIAGVLQVFCLFRWSVLGLPDELGKTYSNMLGDSMALTSSLIYTMIFLAMFVPVSLVLDSWTYKMGEEKSTSNDKEKVKEWLTKNGLYRSPKRIIGNFALLAAPGLITILHEIIKTFLV